MWLLNRFIEIKFIHYSTPQCKVDNSMQPRPQSTLHFLPYPMTSSQPPLALLLNGLCYSGHPAQQHHRNTWSFLTDLLHLPTVKGHPSSIGISVLLLCIAEQYSTEWMYHTFSIHIAILFYYLSIHKTMDTFTLEWVWKLLLWTIHIWISVWTCKCASVGHCQCNKDLLYQCACCLCANSARDFCFMTTNSCQAHDLGLWSQHMGGRGRSVSVQG